MKEGGAIEARLRKDMKTIIRIKYDCGNNVYNVKTTSKKARSAQNCEWGTCIEKKRLMYFSCAFAAEHHVRNLQKPTVSYGWFLEPVPEFDVAPLPCH